MNNPTDTPVNGGERPAPGDRPTPIPIRGRDTITFDPTVFSTSQTITLGGSQLDLLGTTASGTLTIQGPGANLLSVSGNNALAHPMFYLNDR